MHSYYLSKSQYLRGLQCHKSIWLYKDGKIKPKPPSKSQQAIFDEGTRVGVEAQKLFPDGKAIKYEGSTFDEKIAKIGRGCEIHESLSRNGSADRENKCWI